MSELDFVAVSFSLSVFHSLNLSFSFSLLFLSLSFLRVDAHSISALLTIEPFGNFAGNHWALFDHSLPQIEP